MNLGALDRQSLYEEKDKTHT